MKSIDFSQGSGEFQLDKRTFEFMQEAYKSLNVLGMLMGTENAAYGNGYILSGVHDVSASSGDISGTGTSYTNGYLYINGEVVPFIGGTATSNIILEESTPTLGTPHDSKYSTKAYRFGTGVGSIPFSSIKRVPKLMEAAFIDEIRIYGGTDLNDLPLGWYLCDGNNGTLNLSGRIPIQYDGSYTRGSDVLDFNLENLHHEGGSRDHELTVGEIPEHKHGLEDGGDQGGNPGGYVFVSNGPDTATTVTNLDSAFTTETGGGGKHTNMPPYKVVYYIQYKGYVKP
jgi:microcystin-dependent protein